MPSLSDVLISAAAPRRTFAFLTEKIRLAGQVVGSADLLAQMADRYYQECLPLLFHEQKEGDAHQHDSPLELMQRTAQFYHTTINERLRVVFADISQAMRVHFQERWNIKRDLYSDYISGKMLSTLNQLSPGANQSRIA